MLSGCSQFHSGPCRGRARACQHHAVPVRVLLRPHACLGEAPAPLRALAGCALEPLGAVVLRRRHLRPAHAGAAVLHLCRHAGDGPPRHMRRWHPAHRRLARVLLGLRGAARRGRAHVRRPLRARRHQPERVLQRPRGRDPGTPRLRLLRRRRRGRHRPGGGGVQPRRRVGARQRGAALHAARRRGRERARVPRRRRARGERSAPPLGSARQGQDGTAARLFRGHAEAHALGVLRPHGARARSGASRS
mmetsp:Transcript_125249/g.354481  ORF Transcript_125249/g.354481 Transcript_125249/m.354481 type:complete len:248 (-) Transcript_125249:75-818(-)